MTLMKEEYEDFMKKIDHAERILDIIKIRELLTPFRRLRENSPLLQEFGLQELRAIPKVRGLVDQTIEIALPLLLEYSVSCLEHFLSASTQKKHLNKMISEHESKVGRELTRKIHEIRIKRNIAIHSYEQRIDQQALNDLNRHQITGYKLGQILRLAPEDIKVDLNSLREFAQKTGFR